MARDRETQRLPGADLDERFAVAQEVMADAAALALGYFERLGSLTIERKGTQDMASQADVETETLIRARFAERFPDDAFLGEETGRSEVEGARGMWVVDPIDGTQPFISGLTSWCLSIGYIRDGVIEMGFISAPARDEVFVGRRGHGATLNGRPITVSRSTSVDDGMLCIGMSPRIGADEVLPMFEALLRQGAIYYREGSGALALAYVAAGRLIGYLEPHINAWDCIGGLALVEAAGGRINAYLTGDALWRGNHIIAAPPAIYPVLAAVLEPEG